MKDYIVHTHAKDGVKLGACDPEFVFDCFAKGDIEAVLALDSFQEVPLGEGQVNFPAYLCALKDIWYDGFLTVERECGDKPEADIKMAVNYLKEVMQAL